MAAQLRAVLDRGVEEALVGTDAARAVAEQLGDGGFLLGDQRPIAHSRHTALVS